MKSDAWAVIALGLLAAGAAAAYPLDGDDSGIRRLAAYRLAQADGSSARLPPGALLPMRDIRLHLSEHREWDMPGADRAPELQTRLQRLIESRDPSYGLAVIDFTDPDRIRWAGVREHRAQIPGSVGKVLCMLALFDGLRRAFADTGDRRRVLAEHVVEAGDWVISDAHKVPHVDPATGRLRFAVISPGDRFTLAEWLDHMISASANSAGSTVWKEAVLLRAFGADYPVAADREAAYFANTPKSELGGLAQAVIDDALRDAGLDPAQFKVGSMWTRAAKTRIPGPGGSTATPLSLARFLLRLEQGRLVDAWSSLEMKRLLYMTKRRYRYVYAPELREAAVFFKSGSLYRCVPEENFNCGKYMGNRDNAMNSIAIIESPAPTGPGQRRYIAVLTSNVLRINSAWDHSRIGAAIEAIVAGGRDVEIRDRGNATDIRDSGRSD